MPTKHEGCSGCYLLLKPGESRVYARRGVLCMQCAEERKLGPTLATKLSDFISLAAKILTQRNGKDSL